jgi:hypothetical protein
VKHSLARRGDGSSVSIDPRAASDFPLQYSLGMIPV